MDIKTYLIEMQNAKERISSAIQIAQRRLSMKDEMKEIADAEDNPDLAMDAAQKQALVANQLTLTEAIDGPLSAAKVALE